MYSSQNWCFIHWKKTPHIMIFYSWNRILPIDRQIRKQWWILNVLKKCSPKWYTTKLLSRKHVWLSKVLWINKLSVGGGSTKFQSAKIPIYNAWSTWACFNLAAWSTKLKLFQTCVNCMSKVQRIASKGWSCRGNCKFRRVCPHTYLHTKTNRTCTHTKRESSIY